MTDFGRDIHERLPKLKRYARSLTRNETDAEDLVQDCVERAITRAGQFQPGTNLDAWLITIMRNLFLNAKRHEKLVRQHAMALAAGPKQCTEPSQLHRVELAQLTDACDGLSDNHRAAIRLLCIDQKTYKEAARAMGVPVATAKTRLFRAREQLRTQFAA